MKPAFLCIFIFSDSSCINLKFGNRQSIEISPSNGYRKPIFSKKKPECLSPACPEVLTFSSHCLAKFQPVFDCFIRHFKLMYEDSGNKEKGYTDTVVFNLHKIKQVNFLGGHLVLNVKTSMFSLCICLLQFLTHKIPLLLTFIFQQFMYRCEKRMRD